MTDCYILGIAAYYHDSATCLLRNWHPVVIHS
jgi:predicted NodU family carbamoyl transferase